MSDGWDPQLAVHEASQELRERLERLLRKRDERFDYLTKQRDSAEPILGHPGGVTGLSGNPYAYCDIEICRLARALEALLR